MLYLTCALFQDHSNPCKKRVRRAGYLGHVYKIATDIQDTLMNKENKKYILEWLETQHSPTFWKEFCDTSLKVTFFWSYSSLKGSRRI